MAGVSLAAYAVPVSLAYATLAGLPPEVGIWGYLLGGLGYALLGSSRQLAVGPTSAISLMIATTVGTMAGGDAERYAQIASLAALAVAVLALLAWALRLSVLVKLVSDSVLVGLKAGAGLAIAPTQLPALLGVAGGGASAIERLALLLGQLGQTRPLVLAIELAAIAALLLGERWLPGRPVALAVVGTAIGAAALLGLPELGVPVTGSIPAGLPTLAAPALRIREVEGILPLAAGVLLLAYIESVSAARGFATRHGYPLDPRQELLGLGAADLAVALGLLDLAGLLASLPKAVLAAVVLDAVAGLIDLRALARIARVSRLDGLAASIALVAVLLLGILPGILLAALASAVLLLIRTARPHVAFLGRIPGTGRCSDRELHPDNEPLPGILAFRPEAALIDVNADAVLETVLARIEATPAEDRRRVVCDLSSAPFVDLSGAAMLGRLEAEVAGRGGELWVVGAHRADHGHRRLGLWSARRPGIAEAAGQRGERDSGGFGG